MVDKREAARFLAERRDDLIERIIDARIMFFNRWDRPRWLKPGAEFCGCDLQHRFVKRIEGDDVISTTGAVYSARHCGLIPAQADGSCHIGYKQTKPVQSDYDDDDGGRWGYRWE